MDLENYLNFFDPKELKFLEKNAFILGRNIKGGIKYKPSSKPVIGILGIEDERIPSNTGSSKSPNLIRKYLYQLYHKPGFPDIYDFGNVKTGKTLNDTLFAVEHVVQTLTSNQVIPIIIGSKYFVQKIFQVLENQLDEINITAIEPNVGLEINNEGDKTYLEKIILDKSNSLNNYTNLGFQSYFVSQKEVDLFDQLNFDAYRLGFVRNNMLQVEPVIRDTNYLILDISAVKHSDAPGNENATPNGLYSEEVCQLAKFAGLGNRIKVFGLFEANPDFDINNQTMKLSAQILWHFIEGIAVNKHDFPIKSNESQFTEFIITVSGIDQELFFYKNNTSLRWWMKIPGKYVESNNSKYIACSYQDYQKACNNELPERLIDIIKRTS